MYETVKTCNISAIMNKKCSKTTNIYSQQRTC